MKLQITLKGELLNTHTLEDKVSHHFQSHMEWQLIPVGPSLGKQLGYEKAVLLRAGRPGRGPTVKALEEAPG